MAAMSNDAAPRWSKLRSDNISNTSSSKELQVAVNEVAQLVRGVIAGYTGNVPEILDFAANYTANFGWGDKSSTSSKSSIEFDEQSGTLLVIQLTKEERALSDPCPLRLTS